MRRVTVSVPAGRCGEVVRIALESGAPHAQVHAARTYDAQGRIEEREVVEIDTATPVARRLAEALLASTHFEPGAWDIAIVHPRAVVGTHPPQHETVPVWVPAIDVYEDLWQFSQITWSLVGRCFLAALLLAYGMIERNLPLMIAGLLFLPYHHQMLAIAFGIRSREWRLIRQGCIALLLCTLLIMAAGAAVAVVTEPPLRYDQFGTLTTGLVVALAIGVAAALASADDAGRRELIGLAATAHITVLPAWLGIVAVFGLSDVGTLRERVTAFLASVLALIIAAVLTYACIGGSAEGLRRYARGADGVGPRPRA